MTTQTLEEVKTTTDTEYFQVEFKPQGEPDSQYCRCDTDSGRFCKISYSLKARYPSKDEAYEAVFAQVLWDSEWVGKVYDRSFDHEHVARPYDYCVVKVTEHVETAMLLAIKRTVLGD